LDLYTRAFFEYIKQKRGAPKGRHAFVCKNIFLWYFEIKSTLMIIFEFFQQSPSEIWITLGNGQEDKRKTEEAKEKFKQEVVEYIKENYEGVEITYMENCCIEFYNTVHIILTTLPNSPQIKKIYADFLMPPWTPN
jgi:hypothetical protein